MCVRMLLYMCPHTTVFVSACCYICVLPDVPSERWHAFCCGLQNWLSKASNRTKKKNQRVPPACCSVGVMTRLLLRPPEMTRDVVSAYYYIYVSSCYYISLYVSSYVCPHTMWPHTNMCVLMLQHMCHHTYMFPHTTMCPHNTIYVCSYCYVCVPAQNKKSRKMHMVVILVYGRT